MAILIELEVNQLNGILKQVPVNTLLIKSKLGNILLMIDDRVSHEWILIIEWMWVNKLNLFYFFGDLKAPWSMDRSFFKICFAQMVSAAIMRYYGEYLIIVSNR